LAGSQICWLLQTEPPASSVHEGMHIELALHAPVGPQSVELLQPHNPAFWPVRRQTGPASFPAHCPLEVQGPQKPVLVLQNWLGGAAALQSVPPSVHGGIHVPVGPWFLAQIDPEAAQSALPVQPQNPASASPASPRATQTGASPPHPVLSVHTQ
jgi:hypothetical protein